ncbi:hypothetical protein [Paenibacillus sp. Y412MC10]|uniref:hypothetical protein n=1 Tax=Geobacillus sp. (strain Y412MC10) TaxID=481743 RepID=UPI0011A26319|nr:hypothetical protein [Paenibacillus sp. Y412MC10]
MNMNINNYNEFSPLPVDVLTGKLIPFGAKIVLYDDDSISLAEGITTSFSAIAPFTLNSEWWNKRVELERSAYAHAAEYLAWEHGQADIGDPFNTPEIEFEPLAG